ncbi:hypothetical protein [Bacillus sp. IBL03825]|uniref:hypothetical protein n=1 Tax=Bacillus sp. IBL03825 TaxID=2953580 RepID=UPI002157BCB6|nr:hypothetical protein [Bacillus sp. IBL03825]MCR6845260.1 hypothetical protein [Bacillus sp. IBL03825]
MILRDHGARIDIEGDEFLLERAGVTVEPSPIRKGDSAISYEVLNNLFHQAWRSKRKDHAVLYAVYRVNYIHQINEQRKASNIK